MVNCKDSPPSPGDFDARLRQARAKRSGTREAQDGETIRSGLGFALRLGVEIVAALAVGVAIGLLLDRWLGTAPWMLVLFFLMGSAAGFLNLYRAVSGLGYAAGYRGNQTERSPESKSPDRMPPDRELGSK